MKGSFVAMLGDMLKDWIKTQIAQAIFGKITEATAVASAIATGQAIKMAYAGASASVLSATFGASAVAGGVAYTTLKALVSKEEGGLLQGKPHAQGGIPIEAEGGEFIMRKKAVEKLGIPFMESINKFAGGGLVTNTIERFQEGGLVTNTIERVSISTIPSPEPTQAPQTNYNISISAPLLDDTVVDSIIPAIDRARREGLA